MLKNNLNLRYSVIESHSDNNYLDFNSIKTILKLNHYPLILKWIHLKPKLTKMHVISDASLHFRQKKIISNFNHR